MNSPIFWRVFLAAIPMLGLVRDTRSGVLCGGLSAVVLIASSSILLIVRKIIPKPVHRMVFFIAAVVLGTSMIQFIFFKESVSGLFMIVSVILLMPPQMLRMPGSWKRAAKKISAMSFLFWALLAGHGFLSELLRQGGLAIFQTAAGSYLLIAVSSPFLALGDRK